MKQLTGADEMWFSPESANTPMHITDIHIYDPSKPPCGHVIRKDVLNQIRQRLDKLFVREKQVPVPFGLDYSYWVEDEDFDLEYHVRHTKLPKPGDYRQLVAEAGRIIETPLDMSRPLWEIHVIEGLNKVFSMITRMHTEVADPVERMARIHEATTYSKEFTDALGGRNMAEMLELAPLVMIYGVIKFASEAKLANHVTALESGIGISNVPGSRDPLYFCGAKQISCYN